APTVPAPTHEMAEKNRQIDARVGELKKKLDTPTPRSIATRVLQRSFIPPLDGLTTYSDIARLNKSRPAVPKLPIMVELPADKRRPTFVMNKGSFLSPGDKVEPGLPAEFHPLPPATPLNRLGVARWLVAPDNPLTARVAVNRFWAQPFGV